VIQSPRRLLSSDVGACLGSVTASRAVADVWYAWVGDHARDVDRFSREYLSSEEDGRRRQYRSREAAERYVVTRSLVRIVLSERLRIPGREIRVNRTDTGKPVVAGGIHFNVTHSADLILVAVSDARPVGVDIERKRDVARVHALVARWLTDAERNELAQLTNRGASSSDAFLRIWSLKEARLKALGVGISGAAGALLHTVDARPLDDLLESLPGRPREQHYVGAIAFA
jgi:4'-phosphopantetheinyl transferase